MFDIGFSELVVIGIVALLVLGPERLPKVARTTGHLLGRLQRYVSDVKSDINREMQLDELKRLQEEARKSAMEFESTVRSEVASIEGGVASSIQSASSAVADLESSFKASSDAVRESSSVSAQLTQAAPEVLPLDANAMPDTMIMPDPVQDEHQVDSDFNRPAPESKSSKT
ncbi:Sec-independent protein translocase protein TatB [Zoogloea sp.]|uniref:Sec-independent protein translocase protein TatB n=1 Tax=Zoogloea sp. TaxID=49181 RepID=UPI0035AEBED0